MGQYVPPLYGIEELLSYIKEAKKAILELKSKISNGDKELEIIEVCTQKFEDYVNEQIEKLQEYENEEQVED